MLATSLVALAPFAALVSAEAATFTHYGSGDQNGSPSCKNPPAGQALACGASSSGISGYTAAISQNVYGVGPGAGAGPACGECWTLSIDEDANGNPITSKTVNITVNNLCPASGNEEWCDIPAGGTNQHGGQVHFDLCSDTGASNAFFTSVGAGKGTATQIQCGSGNSVESSSAASLSSAAPTSSTPSSAAASYSSAPSAVSSGSLSLPGGQGGVQTSAAAATTSSPWQGGYSGARGATSNAAGAAPTSLFTPVGPKYTPRPSPFVQPGHLPFGHPHLHGSPYAQGGSPAGSAGESGEYGQGSPANSGTAPSERDECGDDEY